ncbi:MAG: putative ABC transport system permease protein [Flavobacteriales bacterium]|jgi:putative ABC transport system permease protein
MNILIKLSYRKKFWDKFHTIIQATFQNILNDSRYAFRKFRSQSIVSLIIVFTLALGIGATSSIFSIANGLLFQVTPYAEADKLVVLKQYDQANDATHGYSVKDINDFRTQSTQLDEIAEYHSMVFTMYGFGDPIPVRAGVTTSNYFPMLGIQPISGRLFTSEEESIGSEALMLISYEFWKNTFDGDEDIIGRTVEMNNRNHKIIGVLPHFPQFPQIEDIYLTVSSCPFRSSEETIENRSARWISSLGKLKDNVDIDTLNHELESISKNLIREYPDSYSTKEGSHAIAASLHDEITQDSKAYVHVLLATTLILLLIACANVSNLILSQHAKRQREFAVRASIGANRWVLVRLRLIESLILAFSGGFIGLLFTYIGTDSLKDLVQNFSPYASEIRIDSHVVIFTLVCAISIGILSGLAPSLHKVELVSALKEGGKVSVRSAGGTIRTALLLGQFALSLGLLTSAGLAVKSVYSLKHQDTGFNSQDIGIVQLDLNFSRYPDASEQRRFEQELLSEVRLLPYIQQSSLSMTYPMDTVGLEFSPIRTAIQFDDRDFDKNSILPKAYNRYISDGYMETLGVELIAGRFFNRNDDENSQAVVIINQSFAKNLWPNQTALEHKISFDEGVTWLSIIGITKDIKEHGLTNTGQLRVYQNLSQNPMPHIAVLAKLPPNLIKSKRYEEDIKAIIKRIDILQGTAKTETLDKAVTNSISFQSLLAILLTIFALLALLITVSGISGVMGYLINSRTRELGIRMAIGANQYSIIKLILMHGLKLSIAGLGLGLITAYIMARTLANELYQVQAFDVNVYSLAFFSLLFVSIIACLIPAFVASRLAPTQALRHQ